MGWLDEMNKKPPSGGSGSSGVPGKTYCWHCAREIPANNFHRQDTCNHCKRSTHACKNCDHYDTTYNNSCRESSADRQVNKEDSNFCDYFVPSKRAPGAGAKGADELKSAADALFKKK